MNIMRVLFLIQLPPPVHGASLINDGIRESAAIQNAFHCRFVNTSPARNMRDIGRITPGKLFRTLGILGSVLKAVARFKPELTYLSLAPTGPAFLRDALLALMMRVFRVPVIIHLHSRGIVVARRKSRFLNRLHRLTFKDRSVIVLSDRLKKDVSGLVAPGRFRVLPNGIARYPAVQGPKETEMIRFLFLSNFIRAKGVLDLLRAVQLLKSRSGDFHVTMAGKFHDPVFEKEFREALQQVPMENLEVIDGVYGKEKQRLLEESHVMVLPTYFDCFPLSLLEGMAHGMGLLSTPEGAIPDVLIDGENGVFVPPGSPEKIARAMIELIENPRRVAAFGKKGREKFMLSYTFEVFEKNLIRILTEEMRER